MKPETGSLKAYGRAALKAALAAGVCCACLLGVMPLLKPQDAHALRVTMKRVIFEGPVRTEVLTIINNTAEEQAYRLGWRRLRMTEDKSLVSVPEGEPLPGFDEMQQMIRYAPRRIVLPPGASQQVRLMLRRPKDMKDGEYRAHFWIQPESESVKFDPNKTRPEGKSAVQIKMLTGVTLPVIVRQGNLTASVKIADAALVTENGQKMLKYTMTREGNRSVYGDIELICKTPAGEEKIIQQLRGIAVYADINRRVITQRTKGVPEGGCTSLVMKYRADTEDQLFKGAVLAEANVKM